MRSSSAASTAGAVPKSISATNAPSTSGPPRVHLTPPRARSSPTVIWSKVSAGVTRRRARPGGPRGRNRPPRPVPFLPEGVGPAAGHDQLDAAQRGDIGQRVPADGDQVGLLAGLQRARLVVDAERPGGPLGGRDERLADR